MNPTSIRAPRTSKEQQAPCLAGMSSVCAWGVFKSAFQSSSDFTDRQTSKRYSQCTLRYDTAPAFLISLFITVLK